MEGWRGGALKVDVILPLKAAALKHDLVAHDFDGGEAPRAVALRGWEAFGTQTGQLSIWRRRQDSHISSACTQFHSRWQASALQRLDSYCRSSKKQNKKNVFKPYTL